MRQPARSDEVWIYHKVMQMYKDVRGGRDVGFLQSRNCAVPLQFWNYNKFWTRTNAVRHYRYSGKFLPPQNRSALCVSTLRLGLERRCRFNSPISLLSDIWLLYAFDTTICTLSACAEWGSASYSARGFAPRPHKPSSAELERALYLSLRSVLGGSFAHSSFLIPHS